MTEITAEYVRRALGVLNNAKIEPPYPYSFMHIAMLRKLGYRGNGKPGDEIEFEGFKIMIYGNIPVK